MPKVPFTLAEARLGCFVKMPYLSRHVMSMVPVPVEGLGTFAVDQFMRMYYDPACLEKWTMEEITGVILHEDLHLVFRHHARFKAIVGNSFTELQRTVWNIAGDLVINQVLRESNVAMPPDGAYPEQFKLPPNLLMEEYYMRLLEMVDKGQLKITEEMAQGSGRGGSASDGVARPWDKEAPSGKEGETPGISPEEQKIIEGQVASDARKFAKEKNAGKLPAGMERFCSEVLEPQVDPVRELSSQVRHAITFTSGHGDFTWRKIPRRQPPGGFRIPAHIRPVPCVVIIADTSGSMTEEDLGYSLGIISRIMRGLPHNGVSVVTGDTRAEACGKYFRADQVRLVGGGGTDMGAIIEDVAENQSPDVIVCCTDGYTPWPAKQVECPVIVCCTQEDPMDQIPSWMKSLYVRPEPHVN